MKRWYHADSGKDFESGAAPISSVLVETDSECDVLLQSESDQEHLLATPPESEGELLLETESEEECAEPVSKKPRKYWDQRTTSHKLMFLNRSVCRAAHMRLYSVGSGALQNMRAGNQAYTMQSGRLQEPHHPSVGVSMVRSHENKKWPSVMSFFWILWISCAEILPVKFTMPGRYEGNTMVESHMSKDPDFQERYVQHFLACLERNYDMNPVTGLLLYDIFLV